MEVIGRNKPCPCGSGKKYKRCCLVEGTAATWVDKEGIHFLQEGAPPSAKEIEKIEAIFQEKIRKSPLWIEMVSKFGEEKAAELLKEFRYRAK